MSTDYASATINNVATVGPPGGPAVQPPIGYDKLTAANTEMWNGHIGSRDDQSGPPINAAALGGRPSDNSSLIALAGTVGRDKAGALMTWVTCGAGCAAAATGTIAGTTFTAGAGAAVAQSTIAANGYGWVKN